MNPEDNIEKFFKNRLNDSTAADDAWNVPSDDIWDKAKVHFPKEEKKRRPIIFWLLGAGMIAGLAIGMIYFFNNGTTIIANDTQNNNIASTKQEPTLNENTTATLPSISKTTEETTKDITTETTDQNHNATTKNLTDKNATLTNEKKATKNKNKKSNFSSRLNNKKIGQPTSNEVSESILPSTAAINPTRTIELIKTIQAPVLKEEEPTISSSVSSADNDLVIDKEVETAVETLAALSPEITNEEEIEDLDLIPFKGKRPIHKWEVGISHARFILEPLVLAAIAHSNEEDSIRINLGTKYRNLNAMVTRRLNGRFSISSGITLTSLDVDLDLEGSDIYNESIANASLRQLVNDDISFGSITIDDESREISLTIKDNVNLMNGDEVDIVANLPLRLTVSQLPVLLNYHFGKSRGKGRLEGMLHAGAALEYFTASIDNLSLGIYRNGTLLTESVNFEPFKVKEFGLAAFVGAGLKYHLTDHWNIALSGKIDLLGIPLSRYDFGLYYGF